MWKRFRIYNLRNTEELLVLYNALRTRPQFLVEDVRAGSIVTNRAIQTNEVLFVTRGNPLIKRLNVFTFRLSLWLNLYRFPII